MYMSEDYNSPQSPYWAMKSFLALGLPETHPFWTAEEKPLPKIPDTWSVVPVKAPMQILCSRPNHHFLLSMGQFCPWPLKATEAKYGKYAYSSHFGFSVPTGTLIQQIAPDSTLALSKDGGDTWRLPWKVTDPRFGPAQLVHKGEVVEDIPSLTSTWKPWADADITVQSHIVAPCSRWPDWYLRWHRVTNTSSQGLRVRGVQGGFAIQGRGARTGETLPRFTSTDAFSTTHSTSDNASPEGTLAIQNSVLICSDAGASGIRTLELSSGGHSLQTTQAELLKPDANTNLMWQRTLIPTLKVEGSATSERTLEFGSAVFALARTEDRRERYDGADVLGLWGDAPVIDTGKGRTSDKEWYVRIE
jgi:hypothetical protein